MPDAGTGEAVDDADAETLGGVGGFDQFFSSALADAFGVAVAVDVVREDLGVAGVDVIADGLADEMGGDGVALEACVLELSALGIAIGLVSLGDLEVVSPAGEFYAVIAEGFGFLEHGIQGQICPLAGKEGDWTAHSSVLDLERGDCGAGGRDLPKEKTSRLSGRLERTMRTGAHEPGPY